jgi:hypothetical protein
MKINYTELFITVSTNVLFISLFLGLFFFTYVAYEEELIVKKQMVFLSDEITGFITLLGPDVKKQFKNYINNLPPFDFSKAQISLSASFTFFPSNSGTSFVNLPFESTGHGKSSPALLTIPFKIHTR